MKPLSHFAEFHCNVHNEDYKQEHLQIYQNSERIISKWIINRCSKRRNKKNSWRICGRSSSWFTDQNDSCVQWEDDNANLLFTGEAPWPLRYRNSYSELRCKFEILRVSHLMIMWMDDLNAKHKQCACGRLVLLRMCGSLYSLHIVIVTTMDPTTRIRFKNTDKSGLSRNVHCHPKMHPCKLSQTTSTKPTKKDHRR